MKEWRACTKRKWGEVGTKKTTAGGAVSVSAYASGPHQCSADTGADTWQKSSFIQHAWVANTCRTSADTSPRQRTKKKKWSWKHCTNTRIDSRGESGFFFSVTGTLAVRPSGSFAFWTEFLACMRNRPFVCLLSRFVAVSLWKIVNASCLVRRPLTWLTASVTRRVRTCWSWSSPLRQGRSNASSLRLQSARDCWKSQCE